MTHSPWRFFLLLILCIALPLQGLSAAVTQACSMQHDKQYCVTDVSIKAPDLTGHSHQACAQDNSHPSSQSCKHCSPCYLGAALPSQILRIETDDLPLLAFAEPPTPPVDLLHDSLERPPRTFA